MKALVIDGYNAINKIPRLRALMDKDLLGARREMTALAKEYKRKTGGIATVTVVFDGQDRYRNAGFSNPPEQRFSRTGEGDRELIRTVSRLSGKYSVIVVSDDNFVRNNARAHNASILSVSEFKKAVDKKKGAAAKDPPRALSTEEIHEINEDLRRYWGV